MINFLSTKVAHAASEGATHEMTIYAESIFETPYLKITNSLLTTWLALFLILVFALFIRVNLKKVPGKLQHVWEVIVLGAMSLCDQITHNRKITEKIFPLVFTIFIFILINNWVGLLPFVSAIGFYEMHEGQKVFVPLFRAGTADVNLTLTLSIMVVVASNLFGVIILGFWKVFNKYINLKGLTSIFTKFKKDKAVVITAPVGFFVGVLEILGEIAKTASLSFRLFGNVFAGEVLLASMAAIFVYVLPGPFLFLEIFVGLIQALIFSLLATVYFTIAAQDHSDHDDHHEGHHEKVHITSSNTNTAS